MRKTLNVSFVGNRFRCGRYMVQISRDKELGIITDVKMIRVGMFVWHLQFKVEVK